MLALALTVCYSYYIETTNTKGNDMTNLQNKEFSARVIANVATLVEKGASFEAAQERVFKTLNDKWPEALATWLKFNA